LSAAVIPFDREVTEPPPPPRGGGGAGPKRFGRVVPLGTGIGRGGKVYVFLDADGERQELSPRNLGQRLSLLSLFGGESARETLRDLWPEFSARKGKETATGDFDAERAAASLMAECGAIGSAAAVQLRRDGVWPHAGGLLVHCGDAVLTGDAEHPPGFRDGRAIYVACEKRARPAADAATADEVGEIAAALALWRYADEAAEVAPQLLLGLIACGLLGIAIPWRPHVFLRGETNAGKSSLGRLIAAACGAGEPADNLTEAGLRRLFDGRSGLIPLDEREADAAGVAGVVRLMRGASDGEGAVTIQAAEGGGAAIFRVAGCFLMAATTLPALTAADASRITTIELRRPRVDSRAEVEAASARASDLHPRLLRRMLERYDAFADTWRAWREAAARRDATSRSADQLGALMAGWWLLTMDRPLPKATADAEMERLAALLETRAAAIEGGAGHAVLAHLLGSRIAITDRTSDQVSVQLALERAAGFQRKGAEFDIDLWRSRLGAAGMVLNVEGREGRGWPWPFEGKPEPGLLLATELPWPRALFHGSDWPKLAWREPLRDLPGCRVSRRHLKFPKGGPSRAVFVPLQWLDLDIEEPAVNA
jgi:hypothetical protein